MIKKINQFTVKKGENMKIRHEKKIDRIERELNENSRYLNSIMGLLRDRDYLVGTKFIGKLKNKELIKDFKEELKTTYFYNCLINEFRQGLDFDTLSKEIKEYNFIHLESFMEILRAFERQQEVLDKYKANI